MPGFLFMDRTTLLFKPGNYDLDFFYRVKEHEIRSITYQDMDF